MLRKNLSAGSTCARLMALAIGLTACKYAPLPELPLDAEESGDAAAGDGSAEADASNTIDARVGETFARSFGGSSSESGTRIATGSDGIVFSGNSSAGIDLGGGSRPGPFFLAKVNGAGQHIWSKGLGAAVEDVVVDRFGNVYVVGGFSSAITFGGGTLTPSGQDLYIAKYDGAGNHLWSRGYGGTGNQHGRRIAILPSDDVVVCGEFSGSANFGGATLSNRGMLDTFCAKFSRADGAHAWSLGFGGGGNDYCTGAIATAAGTTVVLGSFAGGSITINGTVHQAPSTAFDMFAAGISGAGDIEWSQRYGGSGIDMVANASLSSQGDMIVVGSFDQDFTMGSHLLDNNAGPDALIARVSPADGSVSWASSVSGSRSEYATSASLLGDEVIVSGWFTGTATIGPSSISTSGISDIDIFLARVRYNDGAVLGGRRFGGAGTDGNPGESAIMEGTAVLTGGFDSNSIDFGVGNVNNAGGNMMDDVYLARVVP